MGTCPRHCIIIYYGEDIAARVSPCQLRCVRPRSSWCRTIMIIWEWLCKLGAEQSFSKQCSSTDSVRLLSENEQKWPTQSARTSVQTTSFVLYRIHMHVEEIVKQTTAEGTKGRKKVLSSFFLFILVHRTSPTPSHVQLWAEWQRESSARVLWHGGNHEKMWWSWNFCHKNFQSWDFQQFQENFEPRKFGAIW